MQVGEAFAGGWSEAGWVPGGGDLYWPLLVMYQQFQQTDFLRQVTLVVHPGAVVHLAPTAVHFAVIVHLAATVVF